MGKTGRRYPPEFKQEAIRLLHSSCEEKHPVANHSPQSGRLRRDAAQEVGQPQADMLDAGAESEMSLLLPRRERRAASSAQKR